MERDSVRSQKVAVPSRDESMDSSLVRIRHSDESDMTRSE